MLVCGINAGHNASAAILRDGRLIGALQEERITRVKNQSGFPALALERLLRSAGASWGDPDAYVFGGRETYQEPGREDDPESRIRGYKELLTIPGQLKRALRHTPLRTSLHRIRRNQHIKALLSQGVRPDRIFEVDHHRSHAAAAYFGGGAGNDVLVLTVDGAGDGRCASVSVADNGTGLRLLRSIREEASIGNLWSVVTAQMGMVPLEHEYKLMGMAPYANGQAMERAKRLFADAFRLSDGAWSRAAAVPDMLFSHEFWRRRLEFTRFDLICAGLQSFTEEFLANWARHWLRKTGLRKLRLSGGLFMNVKLNKVIGELPEVDDLFVAPSCGDETNAMGAAWAFLADRGLGEQIEGFGPLYLGPELGTTAQEDAAKLAREAGFQIHQPESLEDEVADLLARGEVVARVDGREEFGARSLGNRALLADPSVPGVDKVLNRAIKTRDFWMPFAPSVLKETAVRYIHNPKRFAAPYMILAFDSCNTHEVKAACHPEDLTIRPQVVERDWNPAYHALLEKFRARTGRGAVLNTSYNIHGEPIASSAADAVSVLRRSGLRYLAMGRFLISKPNALTNTNLSPESI